jgi:hypothetical protein
MKLIVEIIDAIDCRGGTPKDYGISCFLCEGASGRINITAHNNPYQIKTAIRLDDLAKRIKETVDGFYSSIETSSASAI